MSEITIEIYKGRAMKRLQMLGFISPLFRGTASGLAALCLCLLPIRSSAQEQQPENAQQPAVEAVAAQPPAPAAVQPDSAAADNESGSRSAVVDTVIKPLLDEASALSAAGKYSEAKEKLSQALKELDPLGSGPYVNSKRDMIKARMAKDRIAWAQKVMEDAREKYRDGLTAPDSSSAESKFNEASSLAKSAAKINPDIDDAAKAFIKDCTRMTDAFNYRENTSMEKVDPRNQLRKDEIHSLLKQSETLYNNQLYSKVRDNMEMILLKDPYNEQAVFMLNKVYKKLYKVAQARRENDALERLSEVEWKWNNAVLPTEAIIPKDSGPKERKTERSGLYEKLQRIVFDNIEFEEATISSVINYLNTRSKSLDPDGTGISLILQLSGVEQDKVPKVTMSFDHIPMGEAIRYLCQSSGLKYRVEDRAVIIGTQAIDEMDIRFFQARAALISTITEGASDTDTATAESGDFGIDSAFGDKKLEDTFKAGGAGATAATTAMKSVTSEALKKYFSDRGIPFEEGSAIAYDKRAGKLIVKNTLENLRKLEALIRDIDIQTPLVLIEAKILEITQTDLEELGFDWVLNSANENLLWQTADTEKILRNYAGVGNMNNTDAASRPFMLVNNMNVLPNFGGSNSYNLFMTVNAIDREDRGEVLSSPKVIATSGTTAIIRMVSEYYFPESWTEPEITIGNGTFTYTPTYPEFGEATDVGIRFEVTPTVSPNNYTISLHLNPQVVSLTGWTDYSYDVIVGGTTTVANIMMPELSRRDVNTNIKVYDGETVVLGGMLKDESAQRDDKWPGLGEVPLLGRLFSSQMNRSQKKNLLIFVTSRLMNSDGVPVRTNALNGIFDFNR